MNRIQPFFILCISIPVVFESPQVTCSIENKYTKESNIYWNQINDAIASFVPCQANCTCSEDQITSDLSAFENGITKEMIESIRSRGTLYQIYENKLYRQKDCLFPARCSGIEHFIKDHLSQLPNMELIINCRDWPQVHNNWQYFGPVFSFSKTMDYNDIMYPAWSFWEGGPAISIYPTGLGRWDLHRQSLKQASESIPWSKKSSKAFFRGSRTSDERDNLILLSRSNPNLVDAQFTKNQAWKSPQDTLNAEPAKEISLEDHCKYKYLFNYRGVAASFRFKHLFLCNSLVFHVGNEWQEFFYRTLKPWIHYVPVPSNATTDELKHLISFFQQHDEVAQTIAQRGFDHIWSHLQMTDIECYWWNLLKNYAKYLKYDIELDSNLMEV